MIKSVSLVGAGNLATQLGLAHKKAGIPLKQVYSRTEKSARELGELLGCSYLTELENLKPSDLVIVSVKDDALPTVLSQIKTDAIVVHTGGSVPMGILDPYFKQFGVFYPLQTFSKKRNVSFDSIPICLEASSTVVYAEIEELGQKLSKHVQAVSSEERQTLHLAAVFTCNFVNHFYHLGDLLLEDKGLDFELLKPLIQETAQKVMTLKPKDAQTGPAVRFDESIINKHLNLLSDQPEMQKMYRSVSESIFHATKKK